MYRGLGDRYDELSAPGPDIMELLHDLILEIPRQNQHVIRFRLSDLLGRQNRNVRPGQVLPLLVRIAVYRVLDEVGANAAVIQQGVALSRGPVTNYGLACAASA